MLPYIYIYIYIYTHIQCLLPVVLSTVTPWASTVSLMARVSQTSKHMNTLVFCLTSLGTCSGCDFTKDGARLKKASPSQPWTEIRAFEWNQRKKNNTCNQIKLWVLRPLGKQQSMVLHTEVRSSPGSLWVLSSLSKQPPGTEPAPCWPRGQHHPGNVPGAEHFLGYGWGAGAQFCDYTRGSWKEEVIKILRIFPAEADVRLLHTFAVFLT